MQSQQPVKKEPELLTFKQKIMALLDDENLSLADFKTKAVELVGKISEESKKTSDAEKTHPVYFSLFYLAASQVCVFQKQWNQKDSIEESLSGVSRGMAYINKAIQYMQNEKHLLAQSPDWTQHKKRLMELCNHQFVIILDKVAELFRLDFSKLVFILSGSYGIEKGEFFEKVTKFFKAIKVILLQLDQHENKLKAFPALYSGDYFDQYHLVHSCLNVIESCVSKCLIVSGETKPEPNKLVQLSESITRAIEECSRQLLINAKKKSLGGDAEMTKAIAPVNIVYLSVVVLRLVKLNSVKASKEGLNFELIFADAMDHFMVRKALKKNTDLNVVFLSLQFYMDFLSLTLVDNPFEEQMHYIKNQLKLYFTSTQAIVFDKHIAACVSVVWQSLLDALSEVWKYRIAFYNYDFRGQFKRLEGESGIEKFKNYLEKGNKKSEEKNLDLEPYNSVTKRRMLRTINASLKELQPVVEILKKMPVDDASDIPKGLIALPCSGKNFFQFMMLLPDLESLWKTDPIWLTGQYHLAAEAFAEDLSLVKEFYTALRDSFMVLSKYPAWFGSANNIGQNLILFVNKRLTPVLKQVEEIQHKLDKQLVEQDDLTQTLKMKHEKLIDELLAEENEKSRLRKLRQEEAAKKRKKKEITIVELENDSSDDFNPFYFQVEEIGPKEKAENKIQEGLYCLSRRNFDGANACYESLKEFGEDYALLGKEGQCAALSLKVIEMLSAIEKNLRAILVSREWIENNWINQSLLDRCLLVQQNLTNDYYSLIGLYDNLLHDPNYDSTALKHSDSLRMNKSFLQGWRQKLQDVWKGVESAKTQIEEKNKLHYYNKVMSNGFIKEQIVDSVTQETIYKYGAEEQLFGKSLNKKTKEYKQFKKIFKSGANHLKSNANPDKSRSPFRSIRKLFSDLDDMLNQARLRLHLDPVQKKYIPVSPVQSPNRVSAPISITSSIPSNTAATTILSDTRTVSASVPAVSTASVDYTSISVSEFVESLCEFQWMTDDESNEISSWIKANPMHFAEAKTAGLIDKELAYECLNVWWITSDLAERISFWDKAGLLRWFMSVPGTGLLIPKEKKKSLNHRLEQIGKIISKTHIFDRKTDLIFAHIFAAVFTAVYTQEELRDYLIHFGVLEKPIGRLCHALELSPACKHALHAYLMLHAEASLFPCSADTVSGLANTAQNQTRSLWEKINIQTQPWYCFLFKGTACYLTDSNAKSNTPVIVRTNIPVKNWPFSSVMNTALDKENQMYYRTTDEKPGMLEVNVNIKFDSALLFEVLPNYCFTVDHILYQPLLKNMVYPTWESYEDFAIYKELRSAHFDLYNIPEFVLETLTQVFCHAGKLTLCENEYQSIVTFIDAKYQDASSQQRRFFEPVFDPAYLLCFLLYDCVNQSVDKVLFSNYDFHRLLAFFFPLPLQAFPIKQEMYDKLKSQCQAFDEERKKYQRPNQDVWMLLGKLIGIVLHTVITPLEDRETLMNEALLQLKNYFPGAVHLETAVKTYVEFCKKKTNKYSGVMFPDSNGSSDDSNQVHKTKQHSM